MYPSSGASPCLSFCPRQEQWRRRLVSAYGSSASVIRGRGGGGAGNFEPNNHTRKRRTRSTSTPPTPAAAASGNSNLTTDRQDNGGGVGDGGGGEGGSEDDEGDAQPDCAAAAVEELCSALGIPCLQGVAASGPAVSMIRAWGRQFAGAFGPAQPGAGVCGIGSEVGKMMFVLHNITSRPNFRGWETGQMCVSSAVTSRNKSDSRQAGRSQVLFRMLLHTPWW